MVYPRDLMCVLLCTFYGSVLTLIGFAICTKNTVHVTSERNITVGHRTCHGRSFIITVGHFGRSLQLATTPTNYSAD